MPLVAATLATQLENMTPVSTEAEAITNFANAWLEYFKTAATVGVPCTEGSLNSALATMKSTLVGWNAPNSAAQKIGAAITAFWGVVVGAAPTIWPAPMIISATPPPGLGGIASALEAVFAANLSARLELRPAVTAVANAIHPLQLGAIAIFPPPPTGIGPQPIL
jgi:hypothetical protein